MLSPAPGNAGNPQSSQKVSGETLARARGDQASGTGKLELAGKVWGRLTDQLTAPQADCQRASENGGSVFLCMGMRRWMLSSWKLDTCISCWGSVLGWRQWELRRKTNPNRFKERWVCVCCRPVAKSLNYNLIGPSFEKSFQIFKNFRGCWMLHRYFFKALKPSS